MRSSQYRLSVVALTLVLMVLGPSPVFTSRPPQGPVPNVTDLGRRANPHSQAVSEETRKQVEKAFGRLPRYFIENKGQVDSRVAYYLNAGDTTVYFTREGLTYALTAKRGSEISIVERLREALRPRTALAAEPGQRDDPQRWALKLDFVGANPGVRPKGQDLHPTIVSYFKGPRDQWHTGLKTYSTIVYEDLWPGINLVYAAASNQMKYMFVVKPGADPGQIRLAYRGATDVSINGAGQLEVATPAANLRDDKPYVYQEIEGRRVEVESVYDLAAGRGAGSHTYGFRAGAYDKSRSLIIDPAVVFRYVGYLGGVNSDLGFGIAVDSAGNTYIAGWTESTGATFPAAAGPDLSFNGFRDAFVAKVNAAGTALIYAGYIGGDSEDRGHGIAVDGAGNAYIVGSTESTEAAFPVTVGPDLTYNGSQDAFVAKVNAAGTALVYAGYIGGVGFDFGAGVAVDSAGSAYAMGTTSSTQATFPVAVGPDLTFNGVRDAFVAKVNAAGTALVYAGYIGGADGDDGTGIAVDRGGSAYLTGTTSSTQATFPVAVGPDLTHNGGSDAFVAKVNAAGTALIYAGYVGGDSGDNGAGIAVDSGGNTYVTGSTDSTEATFPVTVGPDLTYNGGGGDAFVVKVNAIGTAFIYAGYIGGSDLDDGVGIAVDNAGSAYVTGPTFSTEATFPVTVGPDATHNGSDDAFVAKVNTAGTAFVYAGYIGGVDSDIGLGIAVDSAGNAYVAGVANSTGATFPVTVGPDLTFGGFGGGFGDGFVAKISETNLVSIDIKPSRFPNALPDTDPLNLSSKGVTPVAIFTTPTFDASTVNVNSVLFVGAPPVGSAMQDVDGDGDLDLKLRFDTQALDLTCDSTEAVLIGQTSSGGVIAGTDTIRILKDKNGAKCP